MEYSGFNTNPTPNPSPKINPIISSITATDKGSITVTNTTLVNDIDALKVLTGKYTLNVTDIGVSDALALKAPSKDATLAISVKDTAANIAANWDKLQAAVKAKTITAITVTDSASSLLNMTAAQLKADADALKLVTGDYKLAVTGVAAADVAKTLTTKNIYSVEVKDTAANILKNLTAIQTAVTAAKIQNVVITDAANPSLSISDIFALTTTLPSVTLATGVKFNVKDTANMIIAHARDDIGDVLRNAGTVTLTDKTTPNLTLADAITLKGIANLATGTKYNVTDGGIVIATQAAITGETVLSGAASVSINKNFTIADAKAVTGIKTLAKGTVYSIADTADNVLAQSSVAGDKILAGANTVTVVDTSANIIAKLDQLEVLAKAGKIADIKFTDTPSNSLNISQDQLVNDAEAIGKIISQRTLPTLTVAKPITPAPLGPITFDLKLHSGFNIWSFIVSPDGNYLCDNSHLIKTDGTGSVDLAPLGSHNFSISTASNNYNLFNLGVTEAFSEDSSTLFGNFTDQNNQPHNFSIKNDGTGYADLTPKGAKFSYITNFMLNGSKAFGIFTDQSDQSDQRHVFSVNKNGTGFIDFTPTGYKHIWLNQITLDGSKAIVYTWDGGISRTLIANTDGSGFVDLAPQDTTNWDIKFSPDGSKVFGSFTDKNSKQHAFISKSDGSGFTDIALEGAKYTQITGLTADESKVFGTFVDQNDHVHAFISKSDGSGFTDITPSNLNNTNLTIGKIATDGKTLLGQFYDQQYYYHIFSIKIDGTGYIDLTPPGGNLSWAIGYTSNNGKMFGQFNDQNNKSHIFSIKQDGTGYADLTPPNSSNVNIVGQTNNGKIYGTYTDSQGNQRGFLTPT